MLRARCPGLGCQELKNVFEKLHKYVGRSVEALVNRPDAPHVFRLHKKVRAVRVRVHAAAIRGTARQEACAVRVAATLSACAAAAFSLLTCACNSAYTTYERTS
jgi:hypothetical protein